MSDDNDIVYELDNISDYILDIDKNKLIIKRKIITITELNFKKFNYTNSIILECKINKVQSEKLKYKSIILYLWDYLNSININFKNITTMRYKEGEYKMHGYSYYKKLDLSVQSKDANASFLEIINLVSKHTIPFYIKIKLENKNIVYFDNT